MILIAKRGPFIAEMGWPISDDESGGAIVIARNVGSQVPFLDDHF